MNYSSLKYTHAHTCIYIYIEGDDHSIFIKIGTAVRNGPSPGMGVWAHPVLQDNPRWLRRGLG